MMKAGTSGLWHHLLDRIEQEIVPSLLAARLIVIALRSVLP